MKFLILILLLFPLVATAATGGKGAGSYAGSQGASGSVSAGSVPSGGATRIVGGGGMARRPDLGKAPPLAEDRKVNEQDCSKPVDWTAGNLNCK